MATFTETPVDAAANPNVLWEPTNRPAQYLMWESNADYCRTVVEVDNTAGTKPILPGTVLRKANGEFKGILFGRPLIAGLKEDRTVTHRGPCIVRDEKLIFPTVTDAPDGVDPGTDNVAENAAATAALEATLRAGMAAAGIDIQ